MRAYFVAAARTDCHGRLADLVVQTMYGNDPASAIARSARICRPDRAFVWDVASAPRGSWAVATTQKAAIDAATRRADA